jgi:hypothetical protein
LTAYETAWPVLLKNGFVCVFALEQNEQDVEIFFSFLIRKEGPDAKPPMQNVRPFWGIFFAKALKLKKGCFLQSSLFKKRKKDEKTIF